MALFIFVQIVACSGLGSVKSKLSSPLSHSRDTVRRVSGDDSVESIQLLRSRKPVVRLGARMGLASLAVATGLICYASDAATLEVSMSGMEKQR